MGHGTPVLLLHSALSSKLQWYNLMRQMSRDHFMLAVDLYGYGDSPFPPQSDNFTLSDEIALVESLLEGIIPDDEPFHVVGHSLGGAVGLRFCYKAPERIRSLTLFEPVAFHLLPETDEALFNVKKVNQLVSQKIGQGDYPGAAEYFIDYWNGNGTFSSYPKEIRLILGQGIKKMRLEFQELLGEPLSLNDYKSIDTPVCLMAGRQSPMEARRVSELLAETLPHCQMHWVDGGHMAPLLQSDVVNEIIEGFIRGVRVKS